MYYFSDRLKRQLAQIPHFPLTVVEAPSGFGKTTAVKEYLRENLSPDAREFWYTCLGESASTAWRGICDLLANADDGTAARLKNLGIPTLDTLLNITAIFRDFQCQTETYLVVDNFQLVDCDIPRELLNVFSTHGSPNLHMIFITRQLPVRQQFSIYNADIHTIHSSAFFFNREDIAGLFRMEGFRLSDEDLKNVFRSTDGWVSAIRLQITNFEENGSFEDTAGIEQLVENAIWNRLAPEEKDFLLSVSVMDSFDARQAAIMIGKEILPDDMENLLKSNDFIRYFPDKGIYTMHSILQDYLRKRFYHCQSEDFRKRMLYLAGRAYAAASKFYTAAQFFFKVRDFDAILSLPFHGTYLINQKENDLMEFIAELVKECPEETLCRYPAAMLTFCFQMYMGGQLEAYRKLCRLLESVMGNGTDLSPEEIRSIKGNTIIMKTLFDYNDIKKMGEGHREAWKILGRPSEQVNRDTPFTFGCPSILCLFWRQSGELENELRDMEEALPRYRKLTEGQGTGADSVMRAKPCSCGERRMRRRSYAIKRFMMPAAIGKPVFASAPNWCLPVLLFCGEIRRDILPQ